MRSPAERFRDPEKLLAELAILRPEEIDVEAIAEHTGATVVYEPLRGCGASLVARGDRAIITVDGSAPRASQRLGVAHELAHWILDRGESGFVPSNPWGDEVEWYDEDGEPDEVSPEHRAEEWACELLLPERMLSRDLSSDAPMTFDTVRELGRQYRTPLLATALRAVASTSENAALVRSRRGEEAKCLRRTDALFVAYLNQQPGPGTVAHGLLRGSREAPGPTPVGADGWLYFNQAWWTTVIEDSLVTADGEVLSLLWWPGVAITEMVDWWPTEVLAAEPGEEALKQLLRSMGRDWKYYPVEWAGGKLVMETPKPDVQRLVIPEAEGLDAAAVRGLVQDVARQKGVEEDEVVMSVANWDLDR